MIQASTYDVAVVGCGPVGSIVANLLGRHGISTVVIEAGSKPYDLPRAIHLDHEIMRILQSAGLAGEVAPHLRQPAGAMDFGIDLSVIRQLQRIVRTDRTGWASDYHFYQPDLEAVLRRGVESHPCVTLLLGHCLERLHQDEDGSTLEVEGPAGPIALRTRYVLGCDGGRSAVRRQIGVDLDDLGFEEPWVVVDALVDGPLTMPAFKGVPDDIDMQNVMFIVGDPSRPTSVIPGVGKHRRWEFMMLPGETAEDFADGARVRELMSPWINGCPFELVRSAVYRFHALVAKTWQARRVFLVGDAAHQTPPFFGQGLCHGIRDAANLVWKLKLVLDGSAGEALLDSYQMEREPQVRAVIDAAMHRGRYVCTLDPKKARLRDIEMKQIVSRTPPAYVDLIPPLSQGVLVPSTGSPSPVGTRFIQPPMRSVDGGGGLA